MITRAPVPGYILSLRALVRPSSATQYLNGALGIILSCPGGYPIITRRTPMMPYFLVFLIKVHKRSWVYTGNVAVTSRTDIILWDW